MSTNQLSFYRPTFLDILHMFKDFACFAVLLHISEKFMLEGHIVIIKTPY
jgi:hypothetical protein